MLTKEECLEALTKIKMYGSINIPLYSLEVIENLIDEHFDNPPLKWEELKSYMWIWDKGEEEWLLVCNKWKEYDKEYLKVCSIYEYDAVCKFEENRFYRKEYINNVY